MALIRSTQILAASLLAFAIGTSGAIAHTAEQEQMCSGDAMRLCGEFIPNVDRITACMIQKYSQLSDGCKAVFHYVPPATATPASYSAKPSRPMNLAPHKRG